MSLETVTTLGGIVLVLYIIGSIAGGMFCVVQWRSIKKHHGKNKSYEEYSGHIPPRPIPAARDSQPAPPPTESRY